MIVNDLILYVAFIGFSGLNSWRKKGEELSLREEVVFSSVKTLFWRIYVGCTIARVGKCLISVGFTIARVWNFRRLQYIQVATAFVHGKNEHFLDASRRRRFYDEVASEWFGSYSLSWFSGIILTSSPYPLQLIKGEELSWRTLAWAWLGWKVIEPLRLEIWLEIVSLVCWLWDLLCQDRLWVAIRSMVSESLEQEVCGERRTVGRDLTTLSLFHI